MDESSTRVLVAIGAVAVVAALPVFWFLLKRVTGEVFTSITTLNTNVAALAVSVGKFGQDIETHIRQDELRLTTLETEVKGLRDWRHDLDNKTHAELAKIRLAEMQELKSLREHIEAASKKRGR